MSYPHWEPVPSNHYLPYGEATGGGAVDDQLPHVRSADLAIDAALRSVPLPDGLLTRLDRFVDAMADSATDSVDYLGC